MVAGPRRRSVIRVCLVEDQTLVRQGIHGLLELVEDIEVAAEARDGAEAIKVIPRSNPDVVLLDVRLPKADGLSVLKKLREAGTLPPTLVLTTFDDDDLVLEAVRAGARGFMLKDVSLEQLTSAIRKIASGGTFIRPAVTARLLEGLANRKHDFESLSEPFPITEREIEVLRLMAGGYSNKEIADSLHLSEGTVKNHVSSILSKMGVRDRTRAVLKAIELDYF